MYSVEEVADLLGLHVRTVRGYIRDGRLNAVRIGKQYRIAPADLEALTGRARRAAPSRGPARWRCRASCRSTDRLVAADRLGTLVLAGISTGDPAHPLRVQVVHDEERNRMKLVIMGGAAATADVLRLLDSVLGGLSNGEDGDA